MARLNGSVDQLGRPLIRVRPSGAQDDILALVDTGFHGELMMGVSTARELKIELSDDLHGIELGNGTMAHVLVGVISLSWMGAQRTARVLAAETWTTLDADAPVAIVGTRLLAPHLLLVDCDAGTVEIETTA